jgi:hypothetical protein
MEKEIQYIGLNDLNESEQEIVKDITNKSLEKTKNLLKEITEVSIHIKPHKKSGHSSRYSILLKLKSNTSHFKVEKEDFDLTKLMHITFKALENEINHYSAMK